MQLHAMDKAYRVANPQVTKLSTDWSKCVLCQEDIAGQFCCPAESK